MIKGKEFNGNRLKSARLYRNKTIAQVSKEAKISIEDINAFEEKELQPKMENILSLCRVLDFQKEYFYENNNIEVLEEGSFFNIHPCNYRINEESYKEKIKITHKIFSFIERYITFPKLDNIHLSINEYDAEEIAHKVRKHYNLSNQPVMNMVNFLEAKGFIVSTINSSKNSVGPFVQKNVLYNNSRYFMVLGNDKKSVPIRNYDLGVLLGHVVLHDYLMGVNLSKDEFKNLKEEANSFARAFLMPKDEFINDLAFPSELEYYVQLKRKYILPIKVMILRAYDLGVISYRKYDYLIKEISKRGWDKKEPLDEIKGANPSLSKQALEVMEENKIMRTDQIVSALAKEGLTMNFDDIEDLLGLKRGKLKPKAIVNKKLDNVVVINFDK